MDFISNKKPQVSAMLDTLGISSVDALFEAIPESLRVPRLEQDDGISEMEGLRLMEQIASRNTYPQYDSYIGAGAYDHHVPALVNAVCSKSEFLTAYTPYQAETSQGLLQAIFEFQSVVCALTGLDVANASVYDAAGACAEAALMALRVKKGRNRIVVAGTLHPHYRAVVEQYLTNLRLHHRLEFVVLPWCSEKHTIDPAELASHIDDNTAGVIFQSPNVFGIIEDIAALGKEVHNAGALLVVAANPLAYGLYASAGDLGADIAVGDMQPLGIPLQFGGPYAGYMACKQEYVRQIPGRLVGETTDAQGKAGFVLTLQAREQHIRRDKATSNICSNQNLAAMASLVTTLWYGPEGLKKLALTNYQRAAYLRQQLLTIPGVSAKGSDAFLNEFAVDIGRPTHDVIKACREQSIEIGLPLSRFFPELDQELLIAVTETKTKEQLDRYVQVMSEVLAS